jgi:hypothetical protein
MGAHLGVWILILTLFHIPPSLCPCNSFALVANLRLRLRHDAWHWTLESNKHNQAKQMDAISKYHNSEIIHGRYISYLYIYIFYIVCILTLEFHFFFCCFVLDLGHNEGGFYCKCNSTCTWTSPTIYSSCNKSYKSYNKILHQYGHCF